MKGQCRACGGTFTLRKDGKVRRHKSFADLSCTVYDACPGGGHEPLPPPQPETSPLTTEMDVDEVLVRRLQQAGVTGRHLRAMSEGKQMARGAGKAPWTHGLSMVEAILVWWELGVRAEVLGDAGWPERCNCSDKDPWQCALNRISAFELACSCGCHE